MKWYKALLGLWLTFKYTKVFPIDYLTKKRIALVGPASSAFNTNKGSYIDSFDVIIRVNKSAHIVASAKFANDIGSRTDILFHSFFENEVSGGGMLDVELYKNQGISFLINPRNNLKGLRNTFNFYKKYQYSQNTYTLPKNMYQQICEPLNGYKPTIGFTAMMTALEADFSELYITGFTFYRTPFGSGYRDQIQNPAEAKAFIHTQGIHNIDLEFAAFIEKMKRNQKNVITDETLVNILKTEIVK